MKRPKVKIAHLSRLISTGSGPLGLREKLLQSHLTVASLGVAMLLVALGGTLLLRSSATRLAVLGGPTVRSSMLALSGTQHSLTALKDWVAEQKLFFKFEREKAWTDEIKPALSELQDLSKYWVDPENKLRLQKLNEYISNLSRTQWWIEDLATKIGNQPAKAVKERDLEPFVEAIMSHVTTLIHLEHFQSAPDKRRLIEPLEGFKLSFLNADRQLGRFVDTGDLSIEDQFRNELDETWAEIEVMKALGAALTEEQKIRLEWIDSELLAFEVFSEWAISIRKSKEWNTAQNILDDEAVNSAWQITELLSAMLASQDQLMQADSKRVTLTSNVAVTLLLTLILAMSILAIFLSRGAAERIARPIWKLSQATKKLATGQLTEDIPVTEQDEVGLLTASFNAMRASLQRSERALAKRVDEIEESRLQLEQQKQNLEKVNQELDSFVYIASHDLRAPLRGIASFATILEEDFKDNLGDDGQDHLDEIRKGVTRMDDLIHDLLALSRISRIKNPYEKVDITQLILSIEERLKFDLNRLKVDLKVTPHIPKIVCDRIKLGEVFVNLLNNAIKFSSKNTEDVPRITIGYVEIQHAHHFFVRDNGIGIDEKYHAQIFGIFKRLHSDKDYEGTGAGLSIVKKIIDDHGGRIWVESKLGEGSEFHFTIPKNLNQDIQPKKVA